MEQTNSPFDLITPDVIENPHGFYSMLRQESPVFQVPNQNMYIVTRYDDCVHVLRTPEVFHQWDGSELAGSNPAMQAAREEIERHNRETGRAAFEPVNTLVTADPPDHTRYRSLMNQAWSAKRTAHDMESQIREVADRLVDEFAEDGRVDIVRKFAYPMPIIVIARILGVPDSEMETFKRWSDDAVAPLAGNLSKERMLECAESNREFGDFFRAQIEDRRRHPRDDVLTVMVQSRLPDGSSLNDAELLSILGQLLVAGNETTTNAIGHAMRIIGSDTALRDRLVSDPRLIPNAVEEVLRYESPVQGLFRRVAVDTELGGMPLPAGASLLVMYGSANRDDAMFPAASTFDADRHNAKRHIAFGHGIHLCLGAPLARAELDIAIETLLTRLPNLRLASSQEVRHNPHPLLRGLEALWLEFDPSDNPTDRRAVNSEHAAGEVPVGLVVTIDENACGGTGDCVRTAPGVFVLGPDGRSRVVDPAGATEQDLVDAAWNCPTSAITVIKDGKRLV